MANPTPKTSSTRAQLPVGLSGAEPPNAPEGALAYATDTELVRVKTSTGWEDVGSGGGGGSITSIVEGPGIDITGGTGPVVTVSADLAAGTGITFSGTHPLTISANTDPSASPFVLKDLDGSYTQHTGPGFGAHIYVENANVPRWAALGDVSAAGDVTGKLSATQVHAIREDSGPTQLTIGAINDFQLLQRVGTTVVGTAYPPTTLVGDVNGPMISNQVNAIHETSGPTQLTLGSIADGDFLKRIGATVVGAVPSIPLAADITSELAPLHWWRADNTVQTGGLVDTIVDNGSSVKSFTQTGAARCPTATDGNGNVYLAFDGVNDYYTAGVAADWTAFHNGTACTYLVVTAFAGAAVASEVILGNGGADSTKIGFDIYRSFTSSTTQGPAWYLSNGNGTQFVAQVRDLGLYSGLQLWIFRTLGNGLTVTSGGVTSNLEYAKLRRTGVDTAWATRNSAQAFSSSSPSNTMYMGRDASTASTYSNARLYEAILDSKCWTDEQVDFYESYVGSKYGLSNLVPSASDAPGGPFVSSLINTYSAKTTPVAADQIYIADSAASNAIKRSNAREVAVAGGAMYEAYPSTTDSWSDEFDEGSSDPTTRGWGVVQIYPTIAAMTRLGDVDYTIVPPTAMTAGQYRSTVRNGQLYLQVGGNTPNIMYVYKATTSAAFSYASAMGGSNYASASQRFSVMVCNTVSFPFINASSSSVTMAQEGNTLLSYKFTGVTQATYFSGAPADVYSAKALVIDWRAGSSLIDCTAMRAFDNLGLHNVNGQSPPTAWVPAFAGVMVANSNSGRVNWIVVDYIRRYPSGTFFPV